MRHHLTFLMPVNAYSGIYADDHLVSMFLNYSCCFSDLVYQIRDLIYRFMARLRASS